MSNMIKVTDLEVIFDNAGGTTIQCDGYAFHFDFDAAAAATDFKVLLDGGDPAEWDGNDENNAIYPTQDQIRNGGYCVFTADDVSRVLSAGEIDDTSWNNVNRFFRALGVTVNE